MYNFIGLLVCHNMIDVTVVIKPCKTHKSSVHFPVQSHIGGLVIIYATRDLFFACKYRDPVGQDCCWAMRRYYVRSVQGILLIYDLTNRNSFERVSRWLTTIQEVSLYDFWVHLCIVDLYVCVFVCACMCTLACTR